MAPQFERGFFLRDGFGIRAKLGIPEPPVPPARADGQGSEQIVDPDDFVAWYRRAAPALASRRHDLPMLYQIWLHRSDTDGKTGRAVYFEANGDDYSVFASLAPTLVARKLPAGWLRDKMLPAQKQSTGYVQETIPRAEDMPTGRGLRSPDLDGNLAITPDRFEDLFLGSGVELEALPFAEVFARELRELATAAAHAKSCRPPAAPAAFVRVRIFPSPACGRGSGRGQAAFGRRSLDGGELSWTPNARPDAARSVRCQLDAAVVRCRAAALRGWRRAVGAAAARGAGLERRAARERAVDLQHTLAGHGIAACSGDAHPAPAPLATLAVELAPDDPTKATVDIEVRDAVTHKRVRRDVDLSRIPDDGRPAAIAIESDELLRASWAEVALDTARARQAQQEARAQVVGTVQQVMAPPVEGAGGLGARAAVEHYFGGTTLMGADGVGRVRLSPRIALEIAGTLRVGPAVSANRGQVSARGAGGSLALLVRVVGGHRASLAAGAGASAGWLEFRPSRRPAPLERPTGICS